METLARRIRTAPLARLYLWLALPFGLFFVFVNPPFGGVPDELSHYFKALALAQGRILPGGETSAPTNYVYLRQSLAEVKLGGRWPAVDGAKVLENLTTRASAEQSPIPSSVGFAYPFGFLPQALGLRLGLWTRAPPLVAFYLARLLAFAAAVALIHAAIRIAPFGKSVFLLVGMLPMSVQQIASLSYDALHLGALLCFAAYVLALAREERLLTAGEKARVLLGSLCGSLFKPGYVLVSLLVFLLPRERFRTRRSYWTFTLGTLFVGVLVLALGKLLFDEGITGANIDPAAQLRFVFAHPLDFLGAVGKTLYLGARLDVEGLLFAPGLMREGSGLSPLFYVLVGLALVLLLRSQEEFVRLTRAQRLVLLATAVAQTLLLFLSLYLVSTPVGKELVLGLQSRYFLGLVPLYVLAFHGSGFRFRSDWIRRNPNVALLLFLVGTFAYVLWSVWKLYY